MSNYVYLFKQKIINIITLCLYTGMVPTHKTFYGGIVSMCYSVNADIRCMVTSQLFRLWVYS